MTGEPPTLLGGMGSRERRWLLIFLILASLYVGILLLRVVLETARIRIVHETRAVQHVGAFDDRRESPERETQVIVERFAADAGALRPALCELAA